MKPTRPIIALILSSLAVACSAETPADSAAPAEEDEAVAEAAAPVAGEVADEDEPAPVAPDRKKGEKKERKNGWKRDGAMGARGPMAVIAAAARELDLSDAQLASLAELKKGMAGKDRSNDGALARALAGAIESGNVDVAAFDGELDAIETRAAEQATAMQSALDKLHETLTPEQRSELVSVLEERMANKRPGAKGKGRDLGMIGMLGHRLELSDEQKSKLEALRDELPAPERGDELEAVVAAFARDDFDAAKLGLGASAGKTARARAEQMINSVAKMMPILDEAQRGPLAEMLEKGMRGRTKRGKPGKPGRGI